MLDTEIYVLGLGVVRTQSASIVLVSMYIIETYKQLNACLQNRNITRAECIKSVSVMLAESLEMSSNAFLILHGEAGL